MRVFFFNTAVDLAQLSSDKDSCCAFWYAPNLTSYRNIDSIVAIQEICLEDKIESAFRKDYPELIKKFPISTFSTTPVSPKIRQKKYFLASSDTIVYSLLPLMRKLPPGDFELFCKIGEGAKKAAQNVGIPGSEKNAALVNDHDYGVLITGVDWGLDEQIINSQFQRHGKNTICIQESTIDFNIKFRKMAHCSFPLFQGIVSLKHVDLKNKVCAVIGNPRYEKLKPSARNQQTLLINVNFTYNIFEEARQNWLDDIVNSCRTLGIEYLVSQHPRDRADLSQYNKVKTSAASVHSILQGSSVLVTRFSSLIHEALCLGRPVIYYNPHGEKLFYDYEPDNKCLIYATTPAELLTAIRRLTFEISNEEILEAIQAYIPRHLGVSLDGQVSDFVMRCIEKIEGMPCLKKQSLVSHLILTARMKLRPLKKFLLRT